MFKVKLCRMTIYGYIANFYKHFYHYIHKCETVNIILCKI